MKKIVRLIVALCCVGLLIGMPANAAEVAAVMNAYTDSDSVVLFVKDSGREIDHVYLGSEEAREFQTEEAGPVRTIVVLDNSLSIDKKYREEIKTFLADLAAAGNQEDTFTIATFAEDLTYLVRESHDYLEIKGQIDQLQFENQDSYFTNVMYTVMNDIDSYEEIRYTRVIVIADGVDNEALGYTDDELNRKIRAASVPIYAVGCSSKGNEENLKKMFALSRMSNGRSYLLDEMTGTEILQDMEADMDVIRVTITPKDQSCDGSSKTVRVAFGEDYAVVQAEMPFKPAAETTAEESASQTETESAEAQEPETEETKDAEPETEAEAPKGEFPKDMILLIGSAAVLLIVVAVVAVTVALKKKKTKEITPRIDLSGIGHSKETMIGLQGGIRLTLQDLDNPSKTFEYPLQNRIFVGRDGSRCQIVIDYNTYVSAVHCQIVLKNGSLFVKDGGGEGNASTNGTFVNDKKAVPELPLPSGCVLKLGQVKFKVTYR